MNPSDELSSLFAAERAEQPPAAHASQGWEQLQGALQADLPALAIAHGPLKLGLSLATKSFLGSGLVAFAVTSAGLGVYAAVEQPAPRQNVAAVTSSVPKAPPAEAMPLASPVAEAPPEPSKPTAVAAPVAQPSSSSASDSTLADEMRLMKSAKRELDGGRAHLATVWLDQHAQLYPQGVFRSEREGLRVLLRCQQGPDQDAARRFLRQNPHSPLVDRITRACQLVSPTTSDGIVPKSGDR